MLIDRENSLIKATQPFHRLTQTYSLKTMINLKKMSDLRKSFVILPNSQMILLFEVVHICFMMYNAFALPFYVCFGITKSAMMVVMESLFIGDSLLSIVVNSIKAVYIDDILVADFWVLLKNYMRTKFFYIDFFCLLPINIILNKESPDSGPLSTFLLILRISRLFQAFFINHFLKKIDSRNRKFTFKINLLKSFLLLACIWHWSSCFWYFLTTNEQSSPNWFQGNSLESQSLFMKYIYSLYFTMNIATTCGFSKQYPFNNLERGVYILLTYTGDLLFALAFGMIAANSEVFPEHLRNILRTRSKIKLLIKKKPISKELHQRIEAYFAYMSGKTGSKQANFRDIGSYVSQQITEDLVFLRARPFLMNFPIFKEANSLLLLRELAFRLDYVIYMPGDYVLIRNEAGEEMFFIIEGLVDVLTAREDETVVTLKPGDYFGEIALFLDTPKRIASVVARTYCELYVLKKKFLEEILSSFPNVRELFLRETDRRIAEFAKKSLKPNKDKVSKSPFFKMSSSYRMGNISEGFLNHLNVVSSSKMLSSIGDHEHDAGLPNNYESFENNDSNILSPPEKGFLSPERSRNNILRPRIVENLREEESSPSESSPGKRNNFYQEKIKNSIITNEDDGFEIDNFEASISQFVEEDEMAEESLKKQRKSRRMKFKDRERRHSRASLKREIRLLKEGQFSIKRGIFIDDDHFLG